MARPASPAPDPDGTDTAAQTDHGRMHGVSSGAMFDDVADADEAFARTCFDDYDALQALWAPYAARHRATFVAIKALGSFYQQVTDATALIETIAHDASTAGLTGVSWELAARGGVAYEVEAFLSDRYRTRGVPHLPGTGHYPPIDDDVLAGDVFCDLATDLGTPHTQPRAWLHFADLLPEPRAQRLEAYRSELDERRQRDLASVSEPEQRYSSADGSLADVLARAVVPTPGVALEAGGIVTELTPGPDGVQVEVAVKLGLLPANFRLRFAEVPPALRKGHWIDFEGVVRGASFRKARKGPPKKIVVEGDGTIVRVVARAEPGRAPDQYDVVASY